MELNRQQTTGSSSCASAIKRINCVPGSVWLDSLFASNTAMERAKELCAKMEECKKLASAGSCSCEERTGLNQDLDQLDLPAQIKSG